MCFRPKFQAGADAFALLSLFSAMLLTSSDPRHWDDPRGSRRDVTFEVDQGVGRESEDFSSSPQSSSETDSIRYDDHIDSHIHQNLVRRQLPARSCHCSPPSRQQTFTGVQRTDGKHACSIMAREGNINPTHSRRVFTLTDCSTHLGYQHACLCTCTQMMLQMQL